MPAKLWLFDLDGTLIDSAPGIHACIDHALVALGRGRLPSAQLPRWIGPPLRQSFAEVCSDADEVEQAVALYRAHYAEVGWRTFVTYPGIPESLQRLAEDGVRLALVTSKLERFARQILGATPWGGLFEAVYGAGEASAHSEKAAQIAQALQDAGVPAAEAVMVGDRNFDIAGARANGVHAIGVLWGYGSRDELLHAGADRLVAGPDTMLGNASAAIGDNRSFARMEHP